MPRLKEHLFSPLFLTCLVFGLWLAAEWELKDSFNLSLWIYHPLVILGFVVFWFSLTRGYPDSKRMIMLIRSHIWAIGFSLLTEVFRPHSLSSFVFPLVIFYGIGLLFLWRLVFGIEDFMDDGNNSGMGYHGSYSYIQSGYVAGVILLIVSFAAMEYAGWLYSWWASLLVLLLGLCLAIGHMAEDYKCSSAVQRALVTYGLSAFLLGTVSFFRAII
jgi:hypothetical protein